MERKEENIEHIMRRISIQSSSLSRPTSSLPLDLVQGILLNLPPKSIVRFRCVSKLWSSITTDPYFINSFGTKSSTQPSLLTFFKKRDKLFVFLFPQHHQNSNETNCSSQPLDSYQKKYTKYCSFGITSITESVHGLICFQNLAQRIVWNPSMRQFLALPKPKPECKDTTVLFLGYDPIEGQHKVVCMPTDETCHECWVLTLRSAQESWRTVKTNHKHLVFPSSYGRCINGVLYYSAYSGDMDFSTIVMSFDVRSEKLEMIKLPSDIKRCMLIPYQGRLASFDNNVTKRGIKLWILEDAEEHRWSCKHFNAPLVYYDRSLETDFKLDGITHAGELIYVPFKFFKSFSILYFDPDRDSFRKVEFKGIVDREFRRRNGLGNSRLHTFPNHIDTLMSL